MQARIAGLDAATRAAVRQRLASVANSLFSSRHAAQQLQLAAAPAALHASLLRMAVTGHKPDTAFDGRKLREQLAAAPPPAARVCAAGAAC